MILTFLLIKFVDGVIHARWWFSSFMDDLSPVQFYQNIPPGYKGEFFDVYILEGEIIRTGKAIFRRKKIELSTFGFYVIGITAFVSIFILYYNLETDYMHVRKDYYDLEIIFGGRAI